MVVSLTVATSTGKSNVRLYNVVEVAIEDLVRDTFPLKAEEEFWRVLTHLNNLGDSTFG